MFNDADSRNRSGSLFHRSGPANPKAAAPIALFGTGRCNSRSIGWRRRLSRHFGLKCSDESQQNLDHVHVRQPECREIAISTSEELDVDFKQFHDIRTGTVLKDLFHGCLRHVFTKVVNDPHT